MWLQVPAGLLQRLLVGHVVVDPGEPDVILQVDLQLEIAVHFLVLVVIRTDFPQFNEIGQVPVSCLFSHDYFLDFTGCAPPHRKTCPVDFSSSNSSNTA